MNHTTETQLNDYLDHALDPAETAAVDTHLTGCAQCRSDLAALRMVVGEIHALPRGIRPERDLLPDIRGAIDRGRIIELPGARRRALWSMRAPLATAALLLIIATAVITQQTVTKKTDARAAAASSAVLVSNELRAVEQQYVNAISDLQALLDVEQSALSAETLKLLQQNLRVIDQAIRESRSAVERDPGNAMVNEMLRAAYEKKLDALRQATSVSAT